MKALAVAAGIVFWTLVLGIAWLALFSGSDKEEPVAVLQIEPAPEPAPAPVAPSNGIDFPPGFSITGPAAPQQAPAVPPVSPPGTTLAPSPDEIGVPDLPETPGDSTAPAAEAPPAAGAPSPVEPPPASAPPPAAEATPPAADMQPPAEPPPPADMPPATDAPPAADAPPLPDRRSEALGSGQLAATASNIVEPEVESAAHGSASPVATPEPDLIEESEYGPLPKVAADGRRPAEVYARPAPDTSQANFSGSARVAVLVNGLGLPGGLSADVLEELPASVSVAYGAYGHDLQDLVAKARAAGHEVLLQIPLEPEDYPNQDPGPHTLLTTLPTVENIKRLRWMMSRFTGYVGVINHMGGKFEMSKESLQPVLEELKKRGLIYLDDGTVKGSTGAQIAGTIGLDYSAVDVQIDAGPSVAKSLAELESEARVQGTAIGMAKAKPEIVRQLAEWAGKLEEKGIVLVPVSAAVQQQRQS